jgi:AcrR family transcriptional regulator
MSNMSSHDEAAVPTAAQGRILEAALGLFARLGYQRTGMAEIAREAGVSRATLYLRFKDKTAVFEALAAHLVTQALAAAEGAWVEGAPLEANLRAAITAKDLPLYRLLHTGPHGAELLSVNADITAKHHDALDRRFAAFLTARVAPLAAAGSVDLSAFGGPEGFGSLVGVSAGGLKHEARSEAAYLEALERLVKVLVKAAR